MIYPSYYPQNGANMPYNGLQQAQATSSSYGANNALYGGNTGIIWIQGEAGAKSYLVAPNSTVVLWDSEAQVIYLKSADNTGMPSMKVLDYTIRDNAKIGKEAESGLPTSEEIEAIRKELKAIRADIDALMKEAEA